MTSSIVFASRTGNTGQLARRIQSCLPPGELCYVGPPAPEAARAQRIFVGFWTDRGDCAQEIGAFLSQLSGKEVFLFGTAGFGGSEEYFAQIAARAAGHLGPDNRLLGSYLCQGRMPPQVRERYQAMARTDPQKAQPMLDNFDRALSHPDQADLDALERAVRAL